MTWYSWSNYCVSNWIIMDYNLLLTLSLFHSTRKREFVFFQDLVWKQGKKNSCIYNLLGDIKLCKKYQNLLCNIDMPGEYLMYPDVVVSHRNTKVAVRTLAFVSLLIHLCVLRNIKSWQKVSWKHRKQLQTESWFQRHICFYFMQETAILLFDP